MPVVTFQHNHLRTTNDRMIRIALKKVLEWEYRKDQGTKIVDEFGIIDGSARVDIAVINGTIHGYELKSDIDTLYRLPGQAEIYNTVLDKMTLVVAKKYLYKAIKLIPDWWGIKIAKVNSHGEIYFHEIRRDEKNPSQKKEAFASLLWKNEALDILEKIDCARGVRSKTKKIIYRRLSESLEENKLKAEVRKCLCTRVNWKSDLMCVPSGG